MDIELLHQKYLRKRSFLRANWRHIRLAYARNDLIEEYQLDVVPQNRMSDDQDLSFGHTALFLRTLIHLLHVLLSVYLIDFALKFEIEKEILANCHYDINSNLNRIYSIFVFFNSYPVLRMCQCYVYCRDVF